MAGFSALGDIDPLLDNAPCGFLSFTDEGMIRAANATFLAMLGFSADELRNGKIERVLAVGSKIFYQTHLFPLLRLQGKADEIFLLMRAKDGSDVATLINAIRREHANEWLTDCVFFHVEERRKFEDALLAAKKAAEDARAVAEEHRHELEMAIDLLERQAMELEVSQEQLIEQAAELEKQRAIANDANEAKSVFLASMSHELRTPLNAIGGYAQLIEMGVHGPVTPGQAEALGRVLKSQQHLLKLINEILDLSRIEAGRQEYQLSSVSVREVLDGTLPMIEPQIASRGLHYSADVPVELRVRVDRERVEQILLNLLSNATKFTAEGGEILVSAALTDAHVSIRVKDSGVGIPSEAIERVFEPFVQVGKSAQRAGGTGLGLAISRQLARGMGGDLRAESVMGVGSVFILTLPSA